jgi:2-polyprenyl-3-methyl-5-hydroxy-6-metoxy-1,4-benzoquinol methylase
MCRGTPVTATLSYAATAPCWVCGGALGDRFHAATLDFAAWHEQDPELAAYTGERVWLQRCRGCGFAQPEQIPALPRYFERMYDQRWAPEWVAAEFESPYKDVIFARILDELARRVPGTPRTLLDIGSHAGRFLHLAACAGWHADGTEINARTAAYAAERSGATVHRVRAERVIDLGRRYDAVTLTDVLEHIPEPVQMLATARTILAPGGWIAVKVPCGPAQLRKETWRARVSRGYRATLADNLVHVNHFSPRALRRALERAGFAAIEVEVAAPECPPGSRAAAAARLTLWRAARALPFGVHTPMALHLQAFARRTSNA